MENLKRFQQTRRSFVKTGATALAGISIVPRHVLGGPGFRPPSDKLALAFVGVGSQGMRVMMDFLRYDTVQGVTVVDVNKGSGNYVEWGGNELRNKVRDLIGDNSWGAPGAWAGREVAQDVVQRYYARQMNQPNYSITAHEDYREMLQREESVDAIVVCTHDALHAPVAIEAMRAGKHVFCQKPMCHTVHESKRMADVARETGVATQVATGNSASEDTRLLTEWIAAGAIGQVHDVYNWSERPLWPQGLPTPTESEPVPEGLNWDLWLGPAPHRPYHSIYQPFVWRAWYDFGTSSVGDVASYSFDTIMRMLKLDAPAKIEASSTPVFPDSYPYASIMRFHFGPRDGMVPVTVHWMDGQLKPAKPEELGDQEFEPEGLLIVGESGKILAERNGGNLRLIPQSAMDAFRPPPKTLPRSIGHYEEWIAAAKGETDEAPGANFGFASKVTDALLLGNIAVRVGETIHWDADRRRITNSAEANGLLHFTYRDGYAV